MNKKTTPGLKIIKINPITNVKSRLAQAYLRKNNGIVSKLLKPTKSHKKIT